jgi:hypothetical protein
MTVRLIALVAMAIGCRGVQSETSAVDNRATVPSLIGAWDAKLSLTSAYQIGTRDPVARMICGTIAFVDNRHGVATGSRIAGGIGVYDLDLPRLGLNWRANEAYPEAIATAARRDRASRSSQDSVTIVLDPGSTERIVLLGRHAGAGIDGQWLAQSMRGTASGLFHLRPHVPATPGC